MDTNFKGLGHEIIDAVIHSAAIRTVQQVEGGGLVICWKANAAEQIESAMAEPLERWCRESLANEEWVNEAMAMVVVGYDKGDKPSDVVRTVIAGFVLRMIGARVE